MTARISIALDRRSKSLLQRAAAYRRQSTGEFVRTTALKEAGKVLRQNEAFVLSGPDWKLFHEALTNPPEPNPALRKAFARYRKTTG